MPGVWEVHRGEGPRIMWGRVFRRLCFQSFEFDEGRGERETGGGRGGGRWESRTFIKFSHSNQRHWPYASIWTVRLKGMLGCSDCCCKC